jgi:hypothetical protein
MTIDISVLRRFKPIRRGISKIFKKNILSGIWLVLAASLSHGSDCKNEKEINLVISAINTGKNVEIECAFLRGCDVSPLRIPERCRSPQEAREKRQECREILNRLNDAKKKRNELCRKAKIKDFESADQCIERLEECSNMDSAELGLDPTLQVVTSMTGVTMPVADYANRCKPMSKEDKREARNEKKRLEEKMERLKKESTELAEDAEKEKQQIEKQIIELNKRAREEDLQMKEAERQDVAEFQRAQVETSKRLREIQTSILKAQSDIARLIAQRSREMAALSGAVALRGCSAELEKIQAQWAKDNPQLARARSFKSANSLISQNTQRLKNQQEQLKECLRNAQMRREELRLAYQSQIDQLEAQIASQRKDADELQSTLALASQQRQQKLAEDQQNKAQILQERMAELRSLQNKLTALTQATQQKIMQNQQELQKLQMELAKISNDLATAESRPEEDITPQELRDAQSQVDLAESELEQAQCVTPAAGSNSPEMSPSGSGRGTQ